MKHTPTGHNRKWAESWLHNSSHWWQIALCTRYRQFPPNASDATSGLANWPWCDRKRNMLTNRRTVEKIEIRTKPQNLKVIKSLLFPVFKWKNQYILNLNFGVTESNKETFGVKRRVGHPGPRWHHVVGHVNLVHGVTGRGIFLQVSELEPILAVRTFER